MLSNTTSLGALAFESLLCDSAWAIITDASYVSAFYPALSNPWAKSFYIVKWVFVEFGVVPLHVLILVVSGTAA